jgi:hypothetical protein
MILDEVNEKKFKRPIHNPIPRTIKKNLSKATINMLEVLNTTTDGAD